MRSERINLTFKRIYWRTESSCANQQCAPNKKKIRKILSLNLVRIAYCRRGHLSISIFPHLSPSSPLSIYISLTISISHAISIALCIAANENWVHRTIRL
jgi:hypothetical protein